jgi:Protein of unknown function (DUF3108)
LLEIRDFSSARPSKAARQLPAWLLWLVVLALHAAVLAAVDTAMSVGRLAAQAPDVLEVAIVQEIRESKTHKNEQTKAPIKAPIKTPQSTAEVDAPTHLLAPVPLNEPLTAPPVPPAQPASPTPSLPAHEPHAQAVTAASTPQAAPAVPLRPAVLPTSALLRYKLIKGNDSAKASLAWRVLPNSAYELVVEATYFGFSAFKQTSSGHLDSTGLLPNRYADKRRGKSEQAAHFDHIKKSISYSNNRPEAALRQGAQDRASMLIHLGSLLAADPEFYREGAVVHLPISNVDELEVWAFEVSKSETLDLPIGQREAIKLTRRPRRAFDQTVELWLAPSEQYLPVRIRFTDSSGITDQQLSSKE